MKFIKSHKIVILVILLAFVGASYFLVNYLALNKAPVEKGEVVTLQTTPTPKSTPSAPVSYKIVPYVEGLYVPWSIVFTSPSRILVDERNGNVREVVNGKLNPTPIFHFDETAEVDESGLLGMTLHPDYKSNKYVYFCVTYRNNGNLTDKIERMVDNGSTLSRDKLIFDNIPAAHYHAGCRIKFGPDGKLYITSGDATTKTLPQDTNSLGGKILRINDDGSIPADNPFGNAVWSYGHRNPQGIAWIGSVMYETEHGPSGNDGPGGGDEINTIKKGANYGWPIVSHKQHKDGMEDPKLEFTPAEAPSGATFYDGRVFPQFKDNFFFTALKGAGIFRVTLNEGNFEQILSYEKMNIDVGRVREVEEGPDGLIYFATSNRDGRGTIRPGDDKIYRLEPNQ